MTLNTPVEGNDPARPQDPGPVAAAEPQADQLAPAAPVDPDEIELQQAIAAVKTEEAAGTPAAPDSAAKVATDPPQPDPQQAAPARKVPMIPKPRFDEVVDRANKAEQAAAYYKGVADARVASAQPAGQAKSAPTPEQRLAQVHAYVDNLAKKFDAGEISMAQFKANERKASEHERAIREAILVAKVRPVEQPVKKDAYLESFTRQLELQHPWVEKFEEFGNDADWQYLKQQAVARLIDRGVDPRDETFGSFQLREEMAVLATQLGPALLSHRLQAKGVALPGQQPAPGQQQKPLSPQAQARATKLDMAANAPPNLASLSGTTGTQGFTLEQIGNLSESDYDKLPWSVRQKHLGLSA